jgi:Nucleotidyl transferase AbiEii toxin, Type IV TA system
VLTPLQHEVAAIVAGLEEARDFALAGGAALILKGDVDRLTQELDFFGLSASDVHRLLPEAELALQAQGLTVRRVREGPGFVRLEVCRGNETTEVDLAADARLFPTEAAHDIRTLSSVELAVDKLLAIFSRAEARDFVDFNALVERFGLEQLAKLASQKDRGFSLEVFAQMLSRFDRLKEVEFGVDPDAYRNLSQSVEAWRQRARELSQERSNTREPGRGLDI